MRIGMLFDLEAVTDRQALGPWKNGKPHEHDRTGNNFMPDDSSYHLGRYRRASACASRSRQRIPGYNAIS